MLGMSVMRVIRGVGGVCEMCTCLARGSIGVKGVSDNRIRGLDWALPILWEQGDF